MRPTKPVVSNTPTSSSNMEAQAPPSSTAPPLFSATQPPVVAQPSQPPNLNYPDSVDSSPRSRNTDSWDEPYAPTAPNKLRFMCSYGGHIVPRPHDKSLCYLGGVTRITVIDRQSSLSGLSSRLSKTLLNGRPFTLKYQLPSEDLDSLISVTTDEDLDNMIDEYDRMNTNTANPSVKPSRIRLFLFTANSESSQSIGPILDSSTKSEDWFWNALNSTGMLNRGLSDSASENCLLGLDDDIIRNNPDSGSRDVEAGQAGAFVNVKNAKQGEDVNSVQDSSMLDNTSSFGSTSSSPSLANLPSIRVHVDNGNASGGGVRVHDQKVEIEEQLARMSVGGLKQDEFFTALQSQQPPQPQPQPQTQQQPQSLPLQSQQKSSGGIDLPSPDSVSSDNSFTNAMSRSKPLMFQDPIQVQSGSTRLPSNYVDPKLNMSDPNALIQMQQQQQPLLHDTHYIQHLPSGSVPIQAYYPVYPSQQQTHPHHLHQFDQQYEALYYLQARQAQAYNLSLQHPNISEPAATAFPPNRQTSPNPAAVPQPSAFNHSRNLPLSKPEVAAATYRTAAVQVPSSQHQQQYVGYSQIHPSQSMAPTSVANANYSYELADPVHGKLYYTQTMMPPTMPQ